MRPVMYINGNSKVGEAVPKTAEQLLQEYEQKILHLELQLSILEKNRRWHKQSEEPAPHGEVVLFTYLSGVIGKRVFHPTTEENMPEYQDLYWQHIDKSGLPEAAQ